MPIRETPSRRIIHVGNFGYRPTKLFLHGVAAKLSNGWVRAGHHVINFSDRDVARWTSLFGHRKLGVAPANRTLLELCRANRPEVLALGHADVILPATLAAIRQDLPDLKVLQWNVDPVFGDHDKGSADNARRIRSKQALVDATFISTAGPCLGAFARDGGKVAFLPNPVDPSLERGRNFERDDLAHDLFFAVGRGDEARHHAGQVRTPDDIARAIAAAAPEVSMSLHGVFGEPFVAGPRYEAAMLACAGGLNLSRRGDTYLYSSDRLSHLAGNGLAVHIDRGTGYGELFGDDQFMFYADEPELFDNLKRLKREPDLRKAVARAGRERYFQLFDTTIVARYMLDVLFDEHDPADYEWPTVWTGRIAKMITVFGEGRGFRVVWLLEEMGLPYRLRPVDMLAGVENDPEFLKINPAGFIPAIQDGDVTMVESIAIMEYLMARYGPTPLAPDPRDPAFPAYQQFLHLGEAGLATPMFFVVVSRILAPEAEQRNWGALKALEVFKGRLGLVISQLAKSPYMAGDTFTAADISVTYALEFAERTGCFVLGEVERAYVARTSAREAYGRAMDTCQATKAWAAKG